MAHEFEIKVVDAEDIRRCNERIGQVSIAAYQILSKKEPDSELARHHRLQDVRALMIAKAAIPDLVEGQYELVLPMENDK